MPLPAAADPRPTAAPCRPRPPQRCLAPPVSHTSAASPLARHRRQVRPKLCSRRRRQCQCQQPPAHLPQQHHTARCSGSTSPRRRVPPTPRRTAFPETKWCKQLNINTEVCNRKGKTALWSTKLNEWQPSALYCGQRMATIRLVLWSTNGNHPLGTVINEWQPSALYCDQRMATIRSVLWSMNGNHPHGTVVNRWQPSALF